jgi:hypothetical protein
MVKGHFKSFSLDASAGRLATYAEDLRTEWVERELHAAIAHRGIQDPREGISSSVLERQI